MDKKILKLLDELDKTRRDFWNISKETGLFLNTLIRTSKIKKILEIGTSNGVSGIYMAEALKAKAEKETEPESNSKCKFQNCHKTTSKLPSKSGNESIYKNKKLHLYTIESNYKLRFPLATANFTKAKLLPYITQILGHAPEAIPKTPKYFDLIFLDATKYEHSDYLKAILPRTRKGSIIITDNAISHKEALAPYFKLISKRKDLQTNLIEIGSGLLISVKK